MGIIEIICIGIGLSMDASAVAMTNGMVYKDISKEKNWAMPVLFGLFQGLMPFIGYYTGTIFSDFLNQYAGIATLLILGVIGGKMIYDGLFPDKEEESAARVLTFKILFMQAIATSIDAFAVGVCFTAMNINIYSAVGVIAITTLICSAIAIWVGKKCGNFLGAKAQIFGGVILLVIGLKAMF